MKIYFPQFIVLLDFSQFTKEKGNWDFWSPFLDLLVVKLWGESFRHCRWEKRTQFMIKLPIFKENICSYLYNSFLGWLPCCLPNCPIVFGTNLTCLPTPCFARIISNMQKYFLNLWSIPIFFYSVICPDILINVLENCIVFVIWAVWALFNFDLDKQKQRFLVWSFTENGSIISFHGGIWSKINKFKTTKDLSFQK